MGGMTRVCSRGLEEPQTDVNSVTGHRGGVCRRGSGGFRGAPDCILPMT